MFRSILLYKERIFFHVASLMHVTGSAIVKGIDLLLQLHFIGVKVTAYSPVECASFPSDKQHVLYLFGKLEPAIKQ